VGKALMALLLEAILMVGVQVAVLVAMELQQYNHMAVLAEQVEHLQLLGQKLFMLAVVVLGFLEVLAQAFPVRVGLVEAHRVMLQSQPMV